jgi:hypothetical protein
MLNSFSENSATRLAKMITNHKIKNQIKEPLQKPGFSEGFLGS